MNELDQLKSFRSDLPGPTEDEIAQARERLAAQIHAADQPDAEPGRPRLPRAILLVLVTALVAAPAGFAIAQAVDDDKVDTADEISPGHFLSLEACPEATAAFEAAGLRGFAEALPIGEGCPIPERVNEIIRTVEQDLQRLEEVERRRAQDDSP